MKNKKIVIVILLIFVMAFTLLGCSKKSEVIEQETSESGVNAGEVISTSEENENGEVTSENTNAQQIDPRVAQPNFYQINEIEYTHVTRFNGGILISPFFRKDLGQESFVSIIPITKEEDVTLPAVEGSMYLATTEEGEFVYETMLEDDAYVKHNSESNYPFFAVIVSPSFEGAKALKATPEVKPYLPRFDGLNNEDIVAIVSLDGNDRPNIVVYESFNNGIVWRYFFYDESQKLWKIFKEVKLQ